MTQLRDETTRRLHRTVLDRQRSGRLPGVFAGVVRGGGLLWQEGIGAAHLDDPGTPPDDDHQFLVASNTKTFTAVLVMALRDEGRLSLDDTLDTYVPEVTQPGLTIRQCLAHVSGMQREPVGDVWETLVNPDVDELVAGFNQAERVHRPHHLWHYSNLVFSMLGEVVARLDAPPLGRLAAGPDPRARWRCGVRRSGSTAATPQGYYVPPFTDVPVVQDQLDLRALNPCGGLASTGRDMARWSAFVADPVAEVLSPDTLEEMCEPQVVMDRERWTAAMGLGFFLTRSGTRTYVGHTGGMPGHITALFTDREAKTGGLVLTSSGTTPTSPASRWRWPTWSPITTRSSRSPGRPGRRCPTTSPSWSASGTPRAARSPSPCARDGSRPAPHGPPRPQAGLALRAGRARTSTGPSRAARPASC